MRTRNSVGTECLGEVFIGFVWAGEAIMAEVRARFFKKDLKAIANMCRLCIVDQNTDRKLSVWNLMLIDRHFVSFVRGAACK